MVALPLKKISLSSRVRIIQRARRVRSPRSADLDKLFTLLRLLPPLWQPRDRGYSTRYELNPGPDQTVQERGRPSRWLSQLQTREQA